MVDPQTVARGCFGDGFIASNNPEFRNEEEPYAFAMAADSDDCFDLQLIVSTYTHC